MNFRYVSLCVVRRLGSNVGVLGFEYGVFIRGRGGGDLEVN